MKLIDRQPVEGTSPTVYIGHRVYRDPRTGTEKTARPWYAEYCVNGKARYRSLKTNVKAMAVRAAHEINPYAPGAKPPPRLTLADLIKEYMDMQRGQGRAPRTIQKYDFALSRLVKWGRDAKVVNAADLTEPKFWAFYGYLSEKGLSEKSRYVEAIIVKQLTRWGHRIGRLAHNALVNAALKEPAPVEQPCFTAEQIAVLLDKAAREQRALFAFFAYTGVRFGEAQQLRWEDLRMDAGAHGTVIIRSGGSRGTTKGRRPRVIPLHPALRDALKDHRRHGEFVFMAKSGDRKTWLPLDEGRTLKALKKLCVACDFLFAKKFKLHTFRHAFASLLVATGAPERHALALMGHASSDVLNHYVHLHDEDLRATLQAINLPIVTPKTGEKAA